MRWTSSLRTTSTLLVLIAVLPALQPAVMGGSRGEDRSTKKKEKPRLTLRAEPSVGFPPVGAVLSGRLTGVDRNDPNFCHAAVTWIRIGPGQSKDSPSKVREDPTCRHPEEEIDVRLSYSKTFNLYRPGSHLFRLEIEGRDQKRIVSGYAKVEVLRPR